MAHLSLYDDDGPDPVKGLPRPIPQRKPTADFELFGPDDDDNDAFYVRPGADSVPAFQPWDTAYYEDGLRQSAEAAAAAGDAHSPSLLPVPDLVPDSPASPSLSYLPNPALRPDVRPSSAPLPEHRARASGNPLGQSLSDLFASHPEPLYLGSSRSPPSRPMTGEHAGGGAPRPPGPGSLSSPAPTSINHSVSSFGRQAQGPPPSQWYHQTSYNQGSDDQHHSQRPAHSQPMPYLPAYLGAQHQAYAFQPHMPSPGPAPSASHHSPVQQHQQLPHRRNDADDYSKTVSPQEAFLDYDDVDHALHSNPLFQSSFGVGVGAGRGASLFAPLPPATSSSSPRGVPATDDPADRLAARLAPGSPVSVASPPPSMDRASSLPPSHSGTSNSAVRYGSRFAVPDNAVSWLDAEDEEDEEEEESDSVGPRAAGKMPAKRQPGVLSQEDDDDDSEEDGEEVHTPVLIEQGSFSGKQLKAEELEAPVRVPLAEAHAPHPQLHHAQLPSLPDAPAHATRGSSVPVASSRRNSPATSTSTSAAAAKPNLRASANARARHPFGVEDDDSEPAADDSGDSDDSDEYVPAAAPAGHRRGGPPAKRSRGASAGPGDDSESDSFDGEFDDDDEEHTATTRRKGGHSQQPNKRRRRAPPPSATASMSPSAIRCVHPNPDGSICGVIFRRPYDLARHKETIHGEGGKVKKEWVCEECHGSFSRKDALIRHARIRNHEAF